MDAPSQPALKPHESGGSPPKRHPGKKDGSTSLYVSITLVLLLAAYPLSLGPVAACYKVLVIPLSP
ncbi:MAG: hypothetical protein ACAI35_16830, partial [Candidatus Methylacidiphilales bacterium]|nr:hypothetical protein [Candidatus Methylacidiphilales bacterium]